MVQYQMAVTKVLGEDLVIHTNKGILIISVSFDNIFWLRVVSKLEKFYLKNMVPEILCGTMWKELLEIMVNILTLLQSQTRKIY